MSGCVMPDTRYGKLRLPQGADDKMRTGIGPEVSRQAVAVGAYGRLHVILPTAGASGLNELLGRRRLVCAPSLPPPDA